MQQKTEAAKDLKLLANVDSLAPARSASRPLPLANPFRHFPNGSNPKRLKCPGRGGLPRVIYGVLFDGAAYPDAVYRG
jgi:hypothetical protein